jgi:antitoxin HigA-1
MELMAIHPGEHLAHELNALGISASELALMLDMPASRITGILVGQGAVTEDAAVRLSRFFGVSAEFWLSLQGVYERRLRGYSI